MSSVFEVARCNPFIHQSPIFSPVQRGRRKLNIEVERICKEGITKVFMREQCDVADEDLFLCILAMSSGHPSRDQVSQDDSFLKMSYDRKMRMDDDFLLSELPCLAISVSSYQLLTEIDKQPNGDAYTWLKKAMKRLSAIQFDYNGNKWSAAFNFLSYTFDEDIKQWTIIINPISAYSIYSVSSQYIQIQRTERHLLKHDTAKSLHSYLSGVVWLHEKSKPFVLDTLVASVYNMMPNDDFSERLLRGRRVKIVEAIKLMNKLLPLWTLKTTGKGANTRVMVSRS